jgi:hypothetical protein
MPFSTACSTPLANFEAGLNYKDVSDPAVMVRGGRGWAGAGGAGLLLEAQWGLGGAPARTCQTPRSWWVHPCTPPLPQPHPNPAPRQVSFPIKGDADGAALVAWTTTPWTLPSNLALCVHPEFTYVKVGPY